MNSRLFLLALATLSLTACFDFAGDKGDLGFSTNARVDLLHAWTPAVALADTTRPSVRVGEHLVDGAEPEEVTWSAGRGIVLKDGTFTQVGARKNGWIQANADGVTDHFRATWRPVDHIDLTLLGQPKGRRVFGILRDQPSPLGVGLRDHRNRPLGFLVGDLDLHVDSGSIWLDDDLVLIESSLDTQVTVSVGEQSTTVELVVVDADDLTLEIERFERNGECTLVARAWAEGIPVLAPGPLSWSHTTDDGGFVSCPEDGHTIHVEPLDTAWSSKSPAL